MGTIQEAVRALRCCVQCVTIADNQSDQVKNSYVLRTSVIQHLFVRTLPLPLPLDHPKARTSCFWGCSKLDRSTQMDILRLLRLLSTHFAASLLSDTNEC